MNEINEYINHYVCLIKRKTFNANDMNKVTFITEVGEALEM